MVPRTCTHYYIHPHYVDINVHNLLWYVHWVLCHDVLSPWPHYQGTYIHTHTHLHTQHIHIQNTHTHTHTHTQITSIPRQSTRMSKVHIVYIQYTCVCICIAYTSCVCVMCVKIWLTGSPTYAYSHKREILNEQFINSFMYNCTLLQYKLMIVLHGYSLAVTYRDFPRK